MKPILFNTEMVRAILDNRKTVTRRVVKEPYYIDDAEASRVSGLAIHRGTRMTDGMPYPSQPYRSSDILYVRETWTHTCIHCKHYPDMCFCPPDCGTCPEFVYKADGGLLDGWPDKRWRPSIHMPREAARIFLRVKDVKVERLQDITEEQAQKEGLYRGWKSTEKSTPALIAKQAFMWVWNSTIKPADRSSYGWIANPWAWVIEFERISKEEAENGLQSDD